MKRIFVFVILHFALYVMMYCQKDTIVYFSKHGEPVTEKHESFDYYQIKCKTENFFEAKRHYLVDSIWYDQKFTFKMINDSIYQLWDALHNLSTRKVKIGVGGFWIQDIKDSSISSGFSKMIFPLVKEGTWTYFDGSHKFLEEYYQNNKLMSNKYWNDDGSVYYSDLFVHVDTPAYFKGGGTGGVSDWLAANILYPEEALQKGISGKIYIQVVITKKGTLDGIKIINGICTSLDNEARRVVANIPNEWIAATIDGKPVNALMIIPINFKLE